MSSESFTASIVPTPFTSEGVNTTQRPTAYAYNSTCYSPDLVRSVDPTYYTVLEVLHIYISSAVIIFGLIGNTLSFHVMHRMTSTASVTLKALAITDSLYLMLNIFMGVYNAISVCFYDVISWTVSIAGIYLLPVLRMIQTISAWLTVLVTVDRYLAVKKPLHAKLIFTEKRIKWAMILLWVLAISLHVPMFFEWEFLEAFDNINCRFILWYAPTDLYKDKIYYITYRVILEGSIRLILPLTVLIILNTHLIIAIRKAQRQRSVIIANGNTSNQRQADTITAMVVGVVTSFTICQTPYIILLAADLTLRLTPPVRFLTPATKMYWILVANFLLLLNSSVNFVIYVAVWKTFRQKLFSCCRTRSRESRRHTAGITVSTVTIDTHL